MKKDSLRKEKIASRNALSQQQRKEFSDKIVERIVTSLEFQQAKTILLYKGIRGEVRLDALEKEDKAFAYPLCISQSEMIALLPQDETAWAEGYFGIQEPVRENSVEIMPEEIDLIICPCTVFDERGGRIGMGAGFYDRYLAKCTNAVVAAVAFECQKAEQVPMEIWDKRMDLIYTEEAIYRCR